MCVRRWRMCVCESLGVNEPIEGVSKCCRSINSSNLLKSCAQFAVCVFAWRLGCRILGVKRCVCAWLTLAQACAILFNYRSGFESEANSAIITGNTSFNILWKSSERVWVCVYEWMESELHLNMFIQPLKGTENENYEIMISRRFFHPSFTPHSLSFHICVSK